LVVQPEPRERHVVTAGEESALRLSKLNEDLWMEGAAGMHWDKRVIATRATRTQVFTCKRAGALFRVDNQHVVRAPGSDQTPEDDLLVEWEEAVVGRDDGRLEPGVANPLEERDRRRLSLHDMPPAR